MIAPGQIRYFSGAKVESDSFRFGWRLELIGGFMMKKAILLMTLMLAASFALPAFGQASAIDYYGFAWEDGGFPPSNPGDVMIFTGVGDAAGHDAGEAAEDERPPIDRLARLVDLLHQQPEQDHRGVDGEEGQQQDNQRSPKAPIGEDAVDDAFRTGGGLAGAFGGAGDCRSRRRWRPPQRPSRSGFTQGASVARSSALMLA